MSSSPNFSVSKVKRRSCKYGACKFNIWPLRNAQKFSNKMYYDNWNYKYCDICYISFLFNNTESSVSGKFTVLFTFAIHMVHPSHKSWITQPDDIPQRIIAYINLFNRFKAQTPKINTYDSYKRFLKEFSKFEKTIIERLQ